MIFKKFNLKLNLTLLVENHPNFALQLLIMGIKTFKLIYNE